MRFVLVRQFTIAIVMLMPAMATRARINWQHRLTRVVAKASALPLRLRS